MGFVAFPGVALLPGDRVASCAVLQMGTVRDCASRMAAASFSMMVVASKGLQPQVGPSLPFRSSTRGMTGVVD